MLMSYFFLTQAVASTKMEGVWHTVFRCAFAAALRCRKKILNNIKTTLHTFFLSWNYLGGLGTPGQSFINLTLLLFLHWWRQMKNIGMELGSSGIGGVFPLRTLKSPFADDLSRPGWKILFVSPKMHLENAGLIFEFGGFPSHADTALMASEPGFCRSSGRNGRTCRETDPTCIFHEQQRSWKRYRGMWNRWTIFQNIMAVEEEKSIKNEGKDTQRNFCWMERMWGCPRALELHLGWLVVPGSILFGRVNRESIIITPARGLNGKAWLVRKDASRCAQSSRMVAGDGQLSV